MDWTAASKNTRRPGRWRYQVPMVALLCACLLGLSTGCPGRRPCKEHHECKIKQRCSEDGFCMAGCGSDLDCPEGQSCDPTLRKCAPRPCKRGGKATAFGCLCLNDSDCKPGHRCVGNDPNKMNCLPVCEPDGPQDPKSLDRCVCPAGMELKDQRCVLTCGAGETRRGDELCYAEPKSDTVSDARPNGWWEWTSKEKLRQRCIKGAIHDENDRCVPEKPTPATAAKSLKAGPQKACPSDATVKWDEDYPKRAGLPTSTKILYVDANAASLGTGTKSLPYSELDRALRAAQDGDVLLLAPGTYPWGQVIAKSVHLVGLCPAKVILEAKPGDTAAGITVETVGVTVEGLTLDAKGLVDVGVDLLKVIGTASLVDLVVQNPREAGVAVAGKGVAIRQCEIKGSQKAGVVVGKDTTSMLIEGALITENATEGVQIDIPSSAPSAEIEIKLSEIAKNGRVGVRISGTIKQVTLAQNAIRDNGTNTPEGGVSISQQEGTTSLSGNLIEGNNPIGVHGREVDVLQLEQNHLQKNVNAQVFSAAIWIARGKQITASENLIEAYGSSGIRIDAADAIALKGNWIEGATQTNPLGAAIAIQPGGGVGPVSPITTVEISENVIRKHQQAGIFVNTAAKTIRIIDNDVRAVDQVAVQIGGPRRGPDLESALILEGNQLDAGARAAVLAVALDTMKLQGNAIYGAGAAGAGVLSLDCTTVELSRNGFFGLALALSIQRAKDARVEANAIVGEAGSGQASTGLLLDGIQRELLVAQNVVSGGDRGGVIRNIVKDAKAELRDNTWAFHRQVGLSLRDNAVRLTVRQERFLGNGGRHLAVFNQGGEAAITKCLFARATKADAAAAIGWGKSAGDGVYVGAKGLLRWVFSQTKPPCDGDGQRWVVALDGGWYARLMRVPHELDICQTWSFDMTARTDDARREASACQECYQKKMGCRWVWTSANVGSPPAQRDAWKPNKVECVVASKFDSCVRLPNHKSADPAVLAYQGVTTAVGQCVTLDKDPCDSNGFCGKDASKTDYCTRERRFSADPSTPPDDYCAQNVVRGPCHSGRPRCEDGRRCVALGQRQVPLSAVPASVTLKDNLFWANPGADLVMDQAGRVLTEDNQYFSCPALDPSSCPERVLFRRDGTSWSQQRLPAGKTIVWQRPSPYSQAAFQSRINGDLNNGDSAESRLLHAPGMCESYDFH